MRLLLDTCVLAELHRPSGHPAVRAVISRIADDALFLSIITVGEFAKGIAKLPSSRRKAGLEDWYTDLLGLFADRILPVDVETAESWGRISADADAAGTPVGTADGLIAATALRHGLVVATRNVHLFKPTGIPILNPWQG